MTRLPSLAMEVTSAFYGETLDLAGRPGAPKPGWAAMPECRAVARLTSAGADGSTIRHFLTLVAALDRARDADRLWKCAADLYERDRWPFAPRELLTRGLPALAVVLRSSGVSQRHSQDSTAWHRIAESLDDPRSPTSVRAAIVEGEADATELLDAVVTKGPDGRARFPMLAGPKVSRMWVRMLAAPGGAQIRGIESIPVAVDVQVRKVTAYLGLARADGNCTDAKVRVTVQQAWQEDVRQSGAVGPAGLEGTCAAVDPAVWFVGKWGCTFCERAGRRLPIAAFCDRCSFDGRAAGAAPRAGDGAPPG